MERDFLKRTTFVVNDAKKAAQFYIDVFGLEVWYDNMLQADHRFPPSGAPDKAEVHLILLASPEGKLGFMSYQDVPFDTSVPSNRSKVKMGEPILVFGTEDVDQLTERAIEAGAQVVSGPANWRVPTPDGQSTTHLRMVAFFDPEGIYMEVSQRLKT